MEGSLKFIEMKNTFIITLFLFTINTIAFSQAVPSIAENTDYLVTFSKQANNTWGDDDHVNIYFFEIPVENKNPFYIRVFDPDVSGPNDMVNGSYNSTTKFMICGGKEAYSNKAGRTAEPKGNYKSGKHLVTKTFSGEDSKLDNDWYAFGPFNPTDGEFDAALKANVFKIIVEGEEGDDGNEYRFFFSTDKNMNLPVEGGNAFSYEISFRLKNKEVETGHLYPFIDSTVTSVKLNNYDFDKDGYVRITSVNKKGHELTLSDEGDWKTNTQEITTEEKNTSLDIQFIKKGLTPNDMTFNITDQANQPLPMFSYPIGGIPKYKYKIEVIYEPEK